MSKSKKNESDLVRLDFIGSNSTGVTGSCICGTFKNESFLLELGGVQDGTVLENYRVNKALLDRIDFTKINYIFILHFHIDHSMLILGAVRRGFRGKIITNHTTSRLLKPLWEDTTHIMESDIKYLQTKGTKIEALYDAEDVSETMNYMCEYEESIIHKLTDTISFKLLKNNHVFGSTSLEMFFKDDNSRVRKLFYSSDMGNSIVEKQFVFDKVEVCKSADIAILESTYNGKDREPITKKSRKEDLATLEKVILNTILEKKGNLICPCFSADRTQNLLVYLKRIFDNHPELSNTQVIVDGKLTSKVTKLYSELLEGEQKILFDDVMEWKNLKMISDYNSGTRMVIADKNPLVIISSSGMADAGHIKEYIKANVRDSKNSIVFSGFSSANSLGSRLKEKIINPDKKTVIIDKVVHSFNCEIFELTSFSSHIQRKELIGMMKQLKVSDKIILVHGDPKGREVLAEETMEEIMSKMDKTTRIISATKNMTVEF